MSTGMNIMDSGRYCKSLRVPAIWHWGIISGSDLGTANLARLSVTAPIPACTTPGFTSPGIQAFITFGLGITGYITPQLLGQAASCAMAQHRPGRFSGSLLICFLQAGLAFAILPPSPAPSQYQFIMLRRHFK